MSGPRRGQSPVRPSQGNSERRAVDPGVERTFASGRVDRRRLPAFAVRYGLFLALGLWIVAMTIASEHFLSWLNFLNVARQAAPVVIVAVGMTFVMATAGIDLSVGSLVALVSVLTPPGLAEITGLGRDPGGVGVGHNGRPRQWPFVRLGLPAFVLTLAALTYLRGNAFVISDGYAVPIGDEGFILARPRRDERDPRAEFCSPLPSRCGPCDAQQDPVRLARLAVGGREEAARAMGIDVGRIKLAVYAGDRAHGGALGGSSLRRGSATGRQTPASCSSSM